MNTLAILDKWRACFGAAMPAGFLCRGALHELWMRIHSLPNAKRYPESQDDRKEILMRQNAVADYVLGEGSPCFLIITRFNYDKAWSPEERLAVRGFSSEEIVALWGDLEPRHLLSFHDEGDEDTLEFFVVEVTWRKGAFDALLMASAEDLTGHLLFANVDKSSVYAPYDGGADLFLPSVAAVSAARQQFAAWLSEREDGL